jgi:predicted amidohydrolase YtcJ
LTGARGFGWVEALAIRDGRVVATGRATDLEGLAGQGTRRWHLAPGQVVTPSITDAHLHLTLASLAASQPDLAGRDLAGVADAIKAAHRQLLARGDETGWLLGHGWSFETLGGRPQAALLDAAAPGRAVALWAHDHHSRWVSSEALRRAGVAGRADPAGGRIERDEQGRATGLLFEHAAGLIDAHVPQPGAAALEAAVVAYAGELARLGVTSVHDPGGVAPDPALRGGPTFYRTLAAAGRLPLRVMACVREEQLERAIEIGFRTGRTEATDLRSATADPGGSAAAAGRSVPGPSGRYRDGWLKLFSDGALGSRTAALLAPYEPGDPAGPPPGGPAGMALRSRGQLAEAAGRAAAAGIASQIHAIGDGAVRAVLDVLAELPTVGQARHRVEHAQLVDPQDVARLAACGIAASVQPCHLLSDAAGARRAWGSRTANAFPLAALDATGVLLPLGTDAPVEPVDPWPGLAAAVTRRGAAWPAEEAFHPEQAIPLARAIRAACLDGPRSLGIVDQGHLEHGAVADLIVVPAGLFEGAPDAATIAGTRPLATLVAGHLVHEAVVLDT